MTTLREAAQQALEALEKVDKEFRKYGRQHWPEAVKAHSAIAPLRAALAEPVQEPVAWMDIDSDGTRLSVRQWSDGNRDEVPLYTAPPQRKPLETKQVEQIMADCFADFADKNMPTNWWHWSLRNFARAIERAHGIGGQT